MQIDNLSWFPGHMTKTRRMIAAEIKHMDAVCEIVDARIPHVQPQPGRGRADRRQAPADRAQPGWTRPTRPRPGAGRQYFRAKGYAVLEANAKSGAGTAQFAAAVRELLRDKLAAACGQKGQVGRVVRVMVLGIPNVGKSTFINKVARRKTARGRGPARRHPLQAVGARGPPRWSCWTPRASSGRSSTTRRLASVWPLQER